MVDNSPKISVCYACKNRHHNLINSLNSIITNNHVNDIVIVDWNTDQVNLYKFIKKHITHKYFKKINFIKINNTLPWILSYAFNISFISAKNDNILKSDCDYVYTDKFINYLVKLDLKNKFYSFDQLTADNENNRHLNGFFYMSKNLLKNTSFFNQKIKFYGYDDDCLKTQLQKKAKYIRFKFNIGVTHIEGDNYERVCNNKNNLIDFYGFNIKTFNHVEPLIIYNKVLSDKEGNNTSYNDIIKIIKPIVIMPQYSEYMLNLQFQYYNSNCNPFNDKKLSICNLEYWPFMLKKNLWCFNGPIINLLINKYKINSNINQIRLMYLLSSNDVKIEKNTNLNVFWIYFDDKYSIEQTIELLFSLRKNIHNKYISKINLMINKNNNGFLLDFIKFFKKFNLDKKKLNIEIVNSNININDLVIKCEQFKDKSIHLIINPKYSFDDTLSNINTKSHIAGLNEILLLNNVNIYLKDKIIDCIENDNFVINNNIILKIKKEDTSNIKYTLTCKGFTDIFSKKRLNNHGEIDITLPKKNKYNFIKVKNGNMKSLVNRNSDFYNNFVYLKKKYNNNLKDILIINPQHGLSNRLRAIASAYSISKSCNKKLIINWIPDNHCDCLFTDLFNINIDTISSKIVIKDHEVKIYNYMEKEMNSKKNEYIDIDHKVVYVKSNCVLNHKDNYKYFNEFFRLIEPNSKIMKLVNKFDTRNMIGIHIRMGGGKNFSNNRYDNLDNWTDSEATKMIFYRRLSHIDNFINIINNNIRENQNIKFFVATDLVKNYIKLLKIYGIKKIKFLNRNCFDRSLNQLYYAVADLILLSKCNKFYGSYWSSFSEIVTHFQGNDREYQNIFSNQFKNNLIIRNKLIKNNGLGKKIKKGISIITICESKFNIKNNLLNWLENDNVDEIIVINWNSNAHFDYKNDKIKIYNIENLKSIYKSQVLNIAIRCVSYSNIYYIPCNSFIEKNFFKTYSLNNNIFYVDALDHDIFFCSYINLIKVNGFNENINNNDYYDDMNKRLEKFLIKKVIDIIDIDYSDDAYIRKYHEDKSNINKYNKDILDWKIINLQTQFKIKDNTVLITDEYNYPL